MRYYIQHLTRFRYSGPVHENLTEVRMAPRTEGNQRCFQFRLHCRPNVQVLRYDDHYGNVVYHFDVPTPHEALEIVAASAVEIDPPAELPDQLARAAWAGLERLASDGEFWDWLQPSSFARPTPALRSLARALALDRRKGDPLSTLKHVSRGIHRHFAYNPESTAVDSLIDEAIRQRSGVCQDFAHVMIALLRGIGMPARYVSGYLFHNGSARDTAPNATHAWVEAYLPELGWIGIDPTNDTIAGERHIRVAIGRDYADVPPTRGVYKGDAESELAVAVTVSQSRREDPDETSLHVVRRSAANDGPQAAQSMLRQQQQQQQQQLA